MNYRGSVLVGGGGHCRSVIDVITLLDRHPIHGILDPKYPVGHDILGHPVLGKDELIIELCGQGHLFIITAGQVKDPGLRIRLFGKVRKAGGEFATIISSLARVAKGVELGAGVHIGHLALVNTASRVGDNCIVNSGAIIEHDCLIGANNHIATGALVNGDCVLGNNNLIGSRAVLRQGVQIGDNCIIGAGSVVLEDVPSGTTVAGVPARPL